MIGTLFEIVSPVEAANDMDKSERRRFVLTARCCTASQTRHRQNDESRFYRIEMPLRP
jgi:hypothetical protein